MIRSAKFRAVCTFLSCLPKSHDFLSAFASSALSVECELIYAERQEQKAALSR